MTAARPVRYAGVAGVAGWLGVSPALVTKWLLRYGNTPPHDCEIVPGRKGAGKPDLGWLDTPERRAEWATWEASRPGRGAGGGRPRYGKKE